MLAEFYLTPHAVADRDGRDGVSVIDDLNRTLFVPELNKAANVPLVCKLGGKKWEDETSRQIALISDSAHRKRAMKLLTKLLRDHRCVDRPEVATDGNGEDDWCKAGNYSATEFPIDGIVTSSKQKPVQNSVVPLVILSQKRFGVHTKTRVLFTVTSKPRKKHCEQYVLTRIG